MGDHLVLLVVVAEDQQPRAHFRPHPLDPRGQLRALQQLVRGQIEGRLGGGGSGTHADGVGTPWRVVGTRRVPYVERSCADPAFGGWQLQRRHTACAYYISSISESNHGLQAERPG